MATYQAVEIEIVEQRWIWFVRKHGNLGRFIRRCRAVDREKFRDLEVHEAGTSEGIRGLGPGQVFSSST